MLNFKTVNIITVLILMLLLLLTFFEITPIWLIFPVLFVWLTLTVLGSSNISWNYHLKSVCSNNTVDKRHIAITFDDGPNPEFTPKILSLLEKYHMKATFFCIGKHIQKHPEIFKSILEKGHTIGNHTYSHSNGFGFFSTKKVISELQQTNQTITKVSKVKPLLYRPAFGVTNPRIKRAVNVLGLTSIGWNQRSFDTKKLSESAIFKRITKHLGPGDIILLHDTSEKTVQVLEQLLLFLQEQHLESVTVDTLCNIKAYA